MQGRRVMAQVQTTTVEQMLKQGRELDSDLEKLFCRFDGWAEEFVVAFCGYIEDLRHSGFSPEDQKRLIGFTFREFMKVQSHFVDSCPDDDTGEEENESEADEFEGGGCDCDDGCSTMLVYRLVCPPTDLDGQLDEQTEFYMLNPDSPMAKALIDRYLEFRKSGVTCEHEFFTQCSCRASCDICGEPLGD